MDYSDSMFASRPQLESMIEVIDLTIRPLRIFQGEQALLAALQRMKGEVLEAASSEDHLWVRERITEVFIRHGLGSLAVH